MADTADLVVLGGWYGTGQKVRPTSHYAGSRSVEKVCGAIWGKTKQGKCFLLDNYRVPLLLKRTKVPI